MAETAAATKQTSGSPEVLPARRRFTVDEYYRMAEAGILRPEERVELLNGEIFRMSPIGSRHAATVDIFTEWLVAGVGKRAVVRVQNPVRLDSGAEPEPDLALLRLPRSRYRTAHPGPQDVLLLIEVSDTTLAFDRDVKLPLYAVAGIPEVWITDLGGERMLVHRDPRGSRYREVSVVGRDGAVSPQAFPNLSLALAELFG